MIDMFKKIFKIFEKREAEMAEYPSIIRFSGGGEFDYNFVMSLDEKEYPKYLSLAYTRKFLKNLNLRHPKTLNEKIQWLKIYDNLPIKTKLTDKVLVRDWVEEKIGAEHLKPVLWVGKSFDSIPFENLPNSFVIKANHGCSWNIFVKDKVRFLQNASLVECAQEQVNGWMSQSYFGWSNFETQYKNIEPQILIEEYLSENSQTPIKEFEVWVFNSKPLFFEQKYLNKETHQRITSVYDSNYKKIDLKFLPDSVVDLNSEPAPMLEKAVEYSKVLGNGFKLVRIDWIECNNKLFFNEMTFTPQSGYFLFKDKYKQWGIKLGSMLKLK